MDKQIVLLYLYYDIISEKKRERERLLHKQQHKRIPNHYTGWKKPGIENAYV